MEIIDFGGGKWLKTKQGNYIVWQEITTDSYDDKRFKDNKE